MLKLYIPLPVSSASLLSNSTFSAWDDDFLFTISWINGSISPGKFNRLAIISSSSDLASFSKVSFCDNKLWSNCSIDPYQSLIHPQQIHPISPTTTKTIQVVWTNMLKVGILGYDACCFSKWLFNKVSSWKRCMGAYIPLLHAVVPFSPVVDPTRRFPVLVGSASCSRLSCYLAIGIYVQHFQVLLVRQCTCSALGKLKKGDLSRAFKWHVSHTRSLARWILTNNSSSRYVLKKDMRLYYYIVDVCNDDDCV